MQKGRVIYMNENIQERQGEKLTIPRLVSNVKYLLSFAMQADRMLVIGIFSSFLFCCVGYSVYNTLFLKYFIKMIQERRFSVEAIVIYICGGVFLLLLVGIVEVGIENWAYVRFLRVNGKLSRQFTKKAADIDLICYDQKEYFNDFVIAAAQSEEMMMTGIFSAADIIGESVGVLTLAVMIISIHPVIALFPVAGFLINIVTRFKITEYEYNYEMEYKRIMRRADYSKRVFYQPEYAKEIKLSDIHIPLKQQFDGAVEEIMGQAHVYGVKIAILSLVNWIFTFTFFSDFCSPVYLGYLALVRRSIGLDNVAAMNSAQEGVRSRLDALNYSLVRFQKVGQFAERFRRFIDYEIQIEKQDGQKSMVKEEAGNKHVLLEVKDMSFRYEGAEKDTLQHINMTIHPGEKVAFVGENGAGKTTFVKLLMRLYDVTEGSICYGGNDIREYATEDYRNHIAAVFQDYQIYGATLAENVIMDEVRPEDEAKIRTALELADFGRKLETLPDGIDTNMTREFREDGTMLSGGEAQKVAIARMFAKDKDLSLAILDEPSSALDPLAEYKLNTNMMNKVKDASIIFISHRLSTTRDADRIYLFENGRIVEEGSHQELMELDGHYAAMFEKQAHYYKQ